MPPDLYLDRLSGEPRPKLFDRTIPPRQGSKTRISVAFAVNMQVGPLIAAPVVMILLQGGTDALQAGLVPVLLLLTAARRSHIAYRRIRMG
ncbi:hypothetical protein ACWEP8_36070 [Streptomyces hydrogenans]